MLIFHLVGTAVIFVALFSLSWLVSLLFSKLHAIHPFPDEILHLITRFEVWIVYVDEGLCGILLLAGGWRFCYELLGDHRYE